MSDVMRRLRLATSGCSHRYMKKLIADYGISTSHWPDPKLNLQLARLTDEEVFVRGRKGDNASLLKRLLRCGLQYRCAVCGIHEWRGSPIRLHLHHINGHTDDNRKHNLQLLCPNCHQQTDNWGSTKSVKRCCRPGCPRVAVGQAKYCSRLCFHIHISGRPRPHTRGPRVHLQRVPRPPLELLLQEIDIHGVCWCGRKYGVSDNAIRKWLRVGMG